MIEQSYLRKITEIIRSFHHEQPLHFFLKNYFRQHRNMGPRDRKIVSSFVYNFYRLGKALLGLKTEERIAIANFLIQHENSQMPDYVIKSFSSLDTGRINNSLDEKISMIKICYPQFDLHDIFPFEKYLTVEINEESFYKSFLMQPLVWIRIRKGFEKEIQGQSAAAVGSKQQALVNFQLSDQENIIAFESSVPLTQSESYQKGFFEIQDYSSQQTAKYFEANEGEHWWDCCAGAGGKSLLFKEKFPNVKLLLSDSRENILENAKERFKKAGLKNYEIKTMDLLTPNSLPAVTKSGQWQAGKLPAHNSFDGIIADVSCSGSGTWARTPEMLSFFNEKQIDEYAEKQKMILKNVTPYLKQGKPLIYITCSVFKKENEGVISYAQENFGFTVEQSEYLKGYTKRADTLFAARLVKI